MLSGVPYHSTFQDCAATSFVAIRSDMENAAGLGMHSAGVQCERYQNPGGQAAGLPIPSTRTL